MFNINFTYLINLLLPPNLRKPKQVAWLSVLLSYLQKIYESFVQFKIDKLYEINFTGQVMYLEKKLQTFFNNSGIVIDDGYFVNNLYLYNSAEIALPVFFSNQIEELDEQFYINYLYNNSEYSNSPHFIVKIPQLFYDSFTNEMFIQLDKIINYYKLVDKKYIVIPYNI